MPTSWSNSTRPERSKASKTLPSTRTCSISSVELSYCNGSKVIPGSFSRRHPNRRVPARTAQQGPSSPSSESLHSRRRRPRENHRGRAHRHGEEVARIASRGFSFLISHKHGRDSTTVGRPNGTLCRDLRHKRCSEVGRSLRLRPRDCLRFMTLDWTSNERSATEKLFAPRLEGFLRAQLPRHATSLAARFRPGPFRRSVCFLDSC